MNLQRAGWFTIEKKKVDVGKILRFLKEPRLRDYFLLISPVSNQEMGAGDKLKYL